MADYNLLHVYARNNNCFGNCYYVISISCIDHFCVFVGTDTFQNTGSCGEDFCFLKEAENIQ